VPIVSGGGGGGGVTSTLTRGDGSTAINTTSASFVDMATMTASIAALVNDKLFITFTCLWTVTTTPQNTSIAIQLTTSGTQIQYLNPAAGGSTFNMDYAIGGMWTVVSGDISGGLVAIKMRYATSAGTLTIVNSGATVPILSVMNLGH
jgi:hypothetical protein